jgi:hypothetical protein
MESNRSFIGYLALSILSKNQKCPYDGDLVLSTYYTALHTSRMACTHINRPTMLNGQSNRTRKESPQSPQHDWQLVHHAAFHHWPGVKPEHTSHMSPGQAKRERHG